MALTALAIRNAQRKARHYKLGDGHSALPPGDAERRQVAGASAIAFSTSRRSSRSAYGPRSAWPMPASSTTPRAGWSTTVSTRWSRRSARCRPHGSSDRDRCRRDRRRARLYRRRPGQGWETVLTPHPGEVALRMDCDEAQLRDRPEAWRGKQGTPAAAGFVRWP